MSRVTPSREYPRKHEGRCRPGVDRRCGCRQQQDGRLLPLREHQRWSWLISSLLRTAMSEGLPGGTLGVSSKSELEGAHAHVARRIESQSTSTGHCVLDGHGEVVGETAVPADADGLRGLADPLAGRRVRAVIESMNGARFVHDALEEHRWDVDRRRTEGQGPSAAGLQDDRIDAEVLAELSWRDLVPAIWLPDPTIRRERELARFRLHLVRHRTTLENRVVGGAKPSPRRASCSS
jgi:hypothetical protein